MYDPYALGLNVHSISGNNAVIHSPLHEDKNPSAVFNLYTGVMYDFSLGVSRNIHDLVKLTGGVIRKTKVLQTKPSLQRSSLHHELIEKSKLAYDNPYLMGRGVTNRQVEKFGILQTNKGVLFTLKDKSGNNVGVIFRKYKGTPKYIVIGKKPALWINDEIDENRELVLVEGVFGVLQGDRQGYQVGAVLGAMVKPSISGWIYDHKRVTGVFDDDKAGYIGSLRLLRYLPFSRVICPGTEMDELKDWSTILSKPKSNMRDVVRLANG